MKSNKMNYLKKIEEVDKKIQNLELQKSKLIKEKENLSLLDKYSNIGRTCDKNGKVILEGINWLEDVSEEQHLDLARSFDDVLNGLAYKPNNISPENELKLLDIDYDVVCLHSTKKLFFKLNEGELCTSLIFRGLFQFFKVLEREGGLKTYKNEEIKFINDFVEFVVKNKSKIT